MKKRNWKNMVLTGWLILGVWSLTYPRYSMEAALYQENTGEKIQLSESECRELLTGKTRPWKISWRFLPFLTEN